MSSPYSSTRPTSNGWHYIRARYDTKSGTWIAPAGGTEAEIVLVEGASKPGSRLYLSTRGTQGFAGAGVLYGPKVPSAAELARQPGV